MYYIIDCFTIRIEWSDCSPIQHQCKLKEVNYLWCLSDCTTHEMSCKQTKSNSRNIYLLTPVRDFAHKSNVLRTRAIQYFPTTYIITWSVAIENYYLFIYFLPCFTTNTSTFVLDSVHEMILFSLVYIHRRITYIGTHERVRQIICGTGGERKGVCWWMKCMSEG